MPVDKDPSASKLSNLLSFPCRDTLLTANGPYESAAFVSLYAWISGGSCEFLLRVPSMALEALIGANG